MPHVIVSRETHSMIKAAATGTFKQEAVAMPDGRLKIWLEDDTHDRLISRFPGISLDFAIQRLFRPVN